MAAMRVRVEAHCAVRRALLEGRARRILRHNAGFKQLSVRQGDFVSFFREQSKHKHTGVWSGPAEVLKVVDGGAHILFQGSMYHVPVHLLRVAQESPLPVTADLDVSEIPATGPVSPPPPVTLP